MAKFYKYHGRTYRSKLEVSVAQQIKRRKKRINYETEKLKYEVPARKATYTPDFKIKTRSGKTIYIEVKGRLTTANRKTALLVREHNPKIDLRFLFAIDNKIRKNSKTRYSDWCEKNGFRYCFMKIPEEWWNE